MTFSQRQDLTLHVNCLHWSAKHKTNDFDSSLVSAQSQKEADHAKWESFGGKLFQWGMDVDGGKSFQREG